MRVAAPLIVLISSTSCLVTMPVTVTGQWLKHPTPGLSRTVAGDLDLGAPPPRASDGRPDLSGIWQRVGPDLPEIRRRLGPSFNPPLVPFTDQNLAYFMPENTPIPLRPWARAVFEERQRSFGAGAPSEQCLPKGVPEAMLAPMPFKIVQGRDLTVILFEEFNRFRQVHTDGRSHPSSPNPSWWGYSVGRWDGDDFVVQTEGFNDETWLDKAGHPHSEKMRTVERFRRLNVGTLNLEVTIDDAEAYTDLWTAVIRFRLLPDTELLEDACENERDAERIRKIHAR